jgi:hypothetical protein
MPTINASKPPGWLGWELRMALMIWMRSCMLTGWRVALPTSATVRIGSSSLPSRMAPTFVGMDQPGCCGVGSCWSGRCDR